MDPAAEVIPYPPDIDVREYIDARKVMKEYNLGPNGALIVAVDMLVNYIDKIKEELDSIKPNYVIIDSPGQLELFAFRQSGPLVLDQLTDDGKVATLFLLDATYVTSPSIYASMLMLLASVYVRLKKPLIPILSKIDMVSRERVKEIISWSEDPLIFSEALSRETVKDMHVAMLAQNIVDLLETLGLSWIPIPVSSVDMTGLSETYAALQRVFSGGEDFLTEEPSGRL